MNILVMGAGAIGSVCGGMLARAGQQVQLVGRQPHMSAIRRHGLVISGLWGKHQVDNLGAYTTIAEVPHHPVDLVLISTKAYDTEVAVRQALPLMRQDTLVLSLQNGLGNVEAIASLVGEERTVGGRVMFGAELVEPGRVEVTVHGGELMLGSPRQVIPMAQIEQVVGAFSQAGIPASATTQIVGFLWAKLLYNCCLNALSALLEATYGQVAEMEATWAIIGEVIQEVFAVATGCGVALFWPRPEDYRRVLLEELIPVTGAHYASMYADLKLGKRTEIDYLNGAVSRLGEERGIPTPANTLLTRLVRARERLQRK